MDAFVVFTTRNVSKTYVFVLCVDIVEKKREQERIQIVATLLSRHATDK